MGVASPFRRRSRPIRRGLEQKVHANDPHTASGGMRPGHESRMSGQRPGGSLQSRLDVPATQSGTICPERMLIPARPADTTPTPNESRWTSARGTRCAAASSRAIAVGHCHRGRPEGAGAAAAAGVVATPTCGSSNCTMAQMSLPAFERTSSAETPCSPGTRPTPSRPRPSAPRPERSMPSAWWTTWAAPWQARHTALLAQASTQMWSWNRSTSTRSTARLAPAWYPLSIALVTRRGPEV